MTTIIAQTERSTFFEDCCVPDLDIPPKGRGALACEDYHSDSLLNDCRQSYAPHDCNAPAPLPLVPLGDLHTLRAHPLLQLLALDDEYAVVFVPSFSQVAVLDRAARDLLARLPLPADSLDEMACQHLRSLQRIGLVTSGDGAIPLPPAPDTLVAWLHLTNACNLRCSYCYLHKTNQAMSEATAWAAIDAVIRSARAYAYRGIALKYAGGEASLQMPLVARMHAYALEQAASHNLLCQGGLLSNGTGLTTRKLDVIRQLGLQLMISLDGTAEFHDAQRPTISGQGSYAATLEGIERALAAGITPTIAVTVTGQSVTGLPDLIAWLLDRELPFTISFYRENDCSSSFAQLQLDEQRIIAGMRAAYAAIERHPPRWSLLGALLDRTDLSAPHSRTCAVGENYLVIDHHGRVAKCQMTINQSITSITANDPLALVRADQSGVQNLPVDQKAGCRSCEWRYWCSGGCAVATYRATGRYDVQSPNCGIYKALYPDVLRLEGRRLLHWHHCLSSVAC